MTIFDTAQLRRLIVFVFCVLNFTFYLHALEIKPVELTTPIQIPGVGFQTFDHTLIEDRLIGNSGIVSGSAYIRWTWRDIEPSEGRYEWKYIDTALARAWRSNQTLEFRIMFEWPGHDAIPQWLIDKGGKVRSTNCEGNHISPDLEDPIIKSAHYKLIRELGRRYNGHPDLGSVDIGSVGLWGEWQEYCDIPLLPSVTEKKAIIDLYHEAFPNTPLVAQSTDGASLAYAAAKNHSGWRGDCWGDYGTDIWHHHQQLYTPANTNNPGAWKNGPVAFEPCALMDAWDQNEVAWILQDTKDWHTSLVSNKTASVPDNLLDNIKALCQKLGYHLTLRKITYPDAVEVNNNFNLVLNWENLGIAPPYRDYRVAIRVKDNQKRVSATVTTETTVKGLLPGITAVTVPCKLPATLALGTYQLEMTLLLNNTNDHITPIAIQGKTSDGWYPLGSIVANKFTGAVRRGNALTRSGAENLFSIQKSNTGLTFIPQENTFRIGIKHAIEKASVLAPNGKTIGNIHVTEANTLIWNAVETNGHRASSGLYFLTWNQNGISAHQKFYFE